MGHPAVPNLPVGTKDTDIFDAVGASGMDILFITRDKKIRTRPAELARLHAAGVKVIIDTSRNNDPNLLYHRLVKNWELPLL